MAEMIPSSETTSKRRFLSRLLLLFLLLPLIFGALLCAGQVALLIGLRYSAVDTSARIQANYLPWPYNLIPAINVAALIEDLERERAMGGLPIAPTLVLQATFWEPPTAIPGAESTSTPAPPPTLPPPTLPPPLTFTPEPQDTAPAQPTASRTATAPPSATPRASATATRPPFIPTATHTEEPQPPPPTATRTSPPPPTATRTSPPTPTATRTSTLAPTATTGPTRTITPQPAATYAPVVPQEENGGQAEVLAGACRASFGYWNQNPRVVSIPLGPNNYLSEEGIDGQPTTFMVGQVSGAFSVDWASGADLIWSLDGRSAVAYWCNP
jgi:hypothetical protein